MCLVDFCCGTVRNFRMKLKTRGRFSGAENLRFYHRELWRLDSYSLDIYTELTVCVFSEDCSDCSF